MRKIDAHGMASWLLAGLLFFGAPGSAWSDQEAEGDVPGGVLAPAPRSPALATGLAVATPLMLIGGGLLAWQASDDEIVFEATDALGIGLVSVGALLGPSAGHAYTGDWGRAGLFTLGRAACGGLALAGGYLTAQEAVVEMMGGGEDDDREGSSVGSVILATGALGWLGLSVWEAIDSYGSAERVNARQAAAGPRLTLNPLLLSSRDRTGESRTTWGLGLAGSC